MNEKLHEFRKKHYTAQNMTLVLQSQETLEKLENADKLEYMKVDENINPEQRKLDSQKPQICYKDEYLSNPGWCMIKGEKKAHSAEEWGFCDTSCKHVKVTAAKSQINTYCD